MSVKLFTCARSHVDSETQKGSAEMSPPAGVDEERVNHITINHLLMWVCPHEKSQVWG